jgi:hypothetical protein
VIQRYKIILIILAGFFASQQGMAKLSPLPVAEKIIQLGFPSQPDALLKTSDALFDEYQRQNEPVSLIFYSYAMLQLANHFELLNDYVKASEYAKLGFFFLDEAVDSYESNHRIRYLRARVDAWLPATLGRCVVTLHDTEIFLEESNRFDATLLAKVNMMRYRALRSCDESARADALMKAMKNSHQSDLPLLALESDRAPDWDVNEINDIFIPLVKGE